MEEAGGGQQLPKEEVRGVETGAGESDEEGRELPEGEGGNGGAAEKAQRKINTDISLSVAPVLTDGKYQ